LRQRNFRLCRLNRFYLARRGQNASAYLIAIANGENHMKKLTLLLTAVSLAVGASAALAQPAAPGGSSAVSSYSPPTEKHVKKPKKQKMKKGASAPMAAPADAASQ
jgi:hypothetical protein